MVQQAKLNDKVTLVELDFSVNLKYCSQVVDFEAQMLSFGLMELVMDHQEHVQVDQGGGGASGGSLGSGKVIPGVK